VEKKNLEELTLNELRLLHAQVEMALQKKMQGTKTDDKVAPCACFPTTKQGKRYGHEEDCPTHGFRKRIFH
jgi:hypothetical protein